MWSGSNSNGVSTRQNQKKRRILYTKDSIATNSVACVCKWHTDTSYKYRYFYKLRVFTLPIKNRFDRDHYCHCVFVCVRMNVMNFFLLFLHEWDWTKKQRKDGKYKAASQEQVSSYVWMFSEAIQKKIGLKRNEAKWINLMGWNLLRIEMMYVCKDTHIGLCSIHSNNFFIVHTFLRLHIALSSIFSSILKLELGKMVNSHSRAKFVIRACVRNSYFYLWLWLSSKNTRFRPHIMPDATYHTND